MQISKNLDFSQKYKEFDLGQKFRNVSNSVKVIENLDFGQNFEIFWFRSNISKIEFFFKISISVKNFENLDFVQNFRKFSIPVKKNVDSGPNFWKNFEFGQKYR